MERVITQRAGLGDIPGSVQTAVEVALGDMVWCDHGGGAGGWTQ